MCVLCIPSRAGLWAGIHGCPSMNSKARGYSFVSTGTRDAVLLPSSNCNMGFYKSYSLQQHDSGEAQRLTPERPLASCGRCLGRRPDGARQAPQWLRLASMGVQRHPTAVTLRSGSLGGTDVRALPLLALHA
jgi:hypothetical protein